MLKTMDKFPPIERRRILLTWLLAPAWLALLVATRAEGFETLAYDVIEFLGIFLVIAAVLGRLWCALYISGRKNVELCRNGPYSLSRNPLYFFSLIGLIGICLAAQNLTLMIVSVAVFLAYYQKVMLSEEKRLLSLFGDEFRQYMADVPRFFPRLDWPEKDDVILVDTRAFTRSLTEAGWFLAVIILIEAIEEMRQAMIISGWHLPI